MSRLLPPGGQGLDLQAMVGSLTGFLSGFAGLSGAAPGICTSAKAALQRILAGEQPPDRRFDITTTLCELRDLFSAH